MALLAMIKKSTQKINKLETPRLHMRSFSHILHRMKTRDNFFLNGI